MTTDDDRAWTARLRNFAARHASHHRPLALVTSGGTAADLEVNAVRYLDNFSTGLRGAVSVEEFLRRGYAVMHLKREGSASPYARVLVDVLNGDERGCGGKARAHFGPTLEWLGELFDCDALEDDGDDENYHDFDDEFEDLHGKLDSSDNEQRRRGEDAPSDPWMYSNQHDDGHVADDKHNVPKPKRRRGQELSLNPRLIHSHALQSTLRERNRVVRQGLLLTVTFRTVDEYLSKLQACAEALRTCGTLGLVYLAAAVSDFYIPKEKRALHKIQSRDYGLQSSASSIASASSFGGDEEGDDGRESTNDGMSSSLGAGNTLTLRLHPVPKVIPALRKKWCPQAFVVGFKLETDPLILRRKSAIAMEKYDVHLVVGNELATRHEKVCVLHRDEDFDRAADDAPRRADEPPPGYRFEEITGAHALAAGFGAVRLSGNAVDALEYATVEYVARRHFRHVSDGVDGGGSAVEAAVRGTIEADARRRARLEESLRRLRREKVKARAKELAWSVAGSALGMAISYGIASMLRRRSAGVAR